MKGESAHRIKIFPFKYKLASFITTIILILLTGSFHFIQHFLEKEFIVRIENKLEKTEEIVSRLMKNKQHQLRDYGLSLRENNLILTMVREEHLNMETRNDIVSNEVLPNYPDIDALIVFDPDGFVLGHNIGIKNFIKFLAKAEIFEEALEGETVSGFLFFGEKCMQIVGEPFFDGGFLTHVVFVGTVIDRVFIKEVKRLSGVDISFLRDDKIFLTTDWGPNRKEEMHLSDELQEVLSNTPHVNAPITRIFLQGEQYLFTTTQDPNGFTPKYALSKSLDKELEFVFEIRNFIYAIGALGLLVSLTVSFFFSQNVSRPIERLRIASKAVENGDLETSVVITTRDEFRQLGHSFNHMVKGLKEKERIRGVMDKVVSKEIAKEMLKGDIQLGGEERVITILFSDIRGFTALSEGMTPKDLLDLLNKYFTKVNHCIENYGGVIDKYIGDAVMALFGAPIANDQQTTSAITSSLAMIKALKKFNLEILRPLGREFKIGIGLNTGSVVTGNMGAETRLNYTAIGDEVNLASRLEGLTKYYQVPIIISESTYKALQAENSDTQLIYRNLDSVQVKGRQEGIDIYDVIDDSKENAEFLVSKYKEAHQLMLNREFGKSLDILQKLIIKYPNDGPSKVLFDRCQHYQKTPQSFDAEYLNNSYVMKDK